MYQLRLFDINIQYPHMTPAYMNNSVQYPMSTYSLGLWYQSELEQPFTHVCLWMPAYSEGKVN